LTVKGLKIRVSKSVEVKSVAWKNFRVETELRLKVRLRGFNAAQIIPPQDMSITLIDECLAGLEDETVFFEQMSPQEVLSYKQELTAAGIVKSTRKKRSDAGCKKGPRTKSASGLAIAEGDENGVSSPPSMNQLV
jgi:hypothetical protein